MNHLMHLEFMTQFDINSGEESDAGIEGIRYPISDKDDFVEAFVKSYTVESGGRIDSDDVFDSLMVWLMKGGIKNLCVYSEAYTASSVRPPNEFEGVVEHPDHGSIELKIKFNYIWGDN